MTYGRSVRIKRRVVKQLLIIRFIVLHGVFVFPSPRPFAWPPALAPNLYLPALAPNLYLLALASNLYLPALALNLYLPALVPTPD